ncbi:E3 ubiquitin-protein ligase ZNRF2 isoform X1 [Sciurus carolinensis]|uniref:E3 ubiquitin-protein ligase ZNRF2 isoform X1 n=1 Tax=Sciurus carolinensis TaxID=30640 RepID=UPI001FB43A50|nr:E3 ubiquitin-protein ligase ZNRF2 isoform X1 [Sciurus carolinensis]
MGAKQSGPAAANGRTRAYSGSDLPSSSSGGANGTAGSGGGTRAAAAGRFPAQVPSAHQPSASGGAAAASAAPAAPRSRSLGGAVGSVASGARAAQSSFSIPNSSSGPYGSQDSVHSSPEDGGGGGGGRDRPAGGGPGGPRLVIGSLPAHLSPHMFGGFKCPVCSKFVPSDEMDLHLVMCLTKPRITYNDTIQPSRQLRFSLDYFTFQLLLFSTAIIEGSRTKNKSSEDVLSKDAGECAICLEELQQGDTIARLPCLCIYHKSCIDEWFEVNRSCPEHPSD